MGGSGPGADGPGLVIRLIVACATDLRRRIALNSDYAVALSGLHKNTAACGRVGLARAAARNWQGGRVPWIDAA